MDRAHWPGGRQIVGGVTGTDPDAGDRLRQIDQHGAGQHRAASLQDLHRQLLVGLGCSSRRKGAGEGSNCAASVRNRNTGPCAPWAASCSRRRCSGRVSVLRQPGQQCAEAGALQRLLDRPEPVGRIGRPARSADSRGRCRSRRARAHREISGGASRITTLRSRVSWRSSGTSRRSSPMPGLAADQFGEHADGPACAGQFGIEHGKPARQRRGAGRDPSLVGPPDRRGQRVSGRSRRPGVSSERQGRRYGGQRPSCPRVTRPCRRAAGRRRCPRARSRRCGHRPRWAGSPGSRAAVRSNGPGDAGA